MAPWPMDRLRLLIESAVQGLGYELYDLRRGGQGGRSLQVFIDCAARVGVDDCSRVSGVVGDLIEASALIDGSYNLEVSSPGLDRDLRSTSDFASRLGELLSVRFRRAGGETVVVGELAGLDEARILIRIKSGEQLEVARSEIIRARQEVIF